MAIYAAKRATDNLIDYIEAHASTPSNLEIKAIAKHGGEWEMIELSQTQYDAIDLTKANFISGESITHSAGITASLDKETIQNDGVEIVTLSIDVNDPTFTGDVNLKVDFNLKDVEPVTSTVAITAGTGAEQITTETVGLHTLGIYSGIHGYATVGFTGVDNGA